jgi:phosphotriesterase-related protein
MSTVMTVLGPIAAHDMGITLVHEHLFTDLRSVLKDPVYLPSAEVKRGGGGTIQIESLGILHRNPFYLEDNLFLDDIVTSQSEVAHFIQAGGKTIVELTTPDKGRSPSKLVKLAQCTGANIIMGCGYYRQLSHPPELQDWTANRIAEEMIKDITSGVGDGGPRAGVIGEIGVSAPITPAEKKVLMAAAKAQHKTNVALIVHVHPWGAREPAGYAVMRILQKCEVDLSKVILSHIDERLDLQYQKDLLRMGVNIAYDNFGKEFHRDASHIQYPTDLQRLEALTELLDRGYINQVVISHDTAFKMDLHRYGRWGYDHILTNILPLAGHLGISEGEIMTILMENPQRILAN